MKGPICGNNIIEGTEQCDDGVKNGNPLYGCDMSCKLTTPKCSLALTPSRGLATFPVSMEVKGSGGVISTIYWGEGPVLR